MSLSTSFSAKTTALLTLLAIVSGCATARETTALPTGRMIITSPASDIPELKSKIAVFPLENLSGTPAPLKNIRAALLQTLRSRNFEILDDTALETFMAGHRIRYVGGIDGNTAQALGEETGAAATLITSVELYADQLPPKIALISRLVSSTNPPAILWMDSIGITGDDSPGLLGLGLIENTDKLLDKALESLAQSLSASVSGTKAVSSGPKTKFRPKITFRSRIIQADQRYRIAVIPFFNRSDRKNGGDIMLLHFVKELAGRDNFDVVEPGVVRQELLRFRIIMDDGLSLADAGALFNNLNADLIFAGKVLDYQDTRGSWGTPVVDFSAVLLENKSRETIWASKSYNKGSDNVFFFDWGRVSTANDMAAQMVENISAMLGE